MIVFSRKNKTSDDFFLGGRQLGPYVTAMSAEASDMSSYLLMGILVGIGLLLFFVPGLILALAYALSFFILKDNPELSAVEVLKKSRMMMRGHKFDLFWLELSFIGWIILGIITLGIGYIWLIPYMYETISVFYEDVKNGTAGLPGDAPVEKPEDFQPAAPVE